ncbi:uncharacterized protein WM294_011176 isoform 1-T2 [Sarcoramphus papa]
MSSLRWELLLHRRTIPLQQLHRRTPRYLHPASPHLPSNELKQPPRWECPYICTHGVYDTFRPCCSRGQGEVQASSPIPITTTPQPHPGWCPGGCFCSPATAPHHIIPPVPNSPLIPGLGLPAFLFGHPHLGAMQAPWASQLPCGDPWLSMSMLAAASAVAMPRPPHCQAPAYPHCPTCTCCPNSAAAGNRAGPQHRVY